MLDLVVLQEEVLQECITFHTVRSRCLCPWSSKFWLSYFSLWEHLVIVDGLLFLLIVLKYYCIFLNVLNIYILYYVADNSIMWSVCGSESGYPLFLLTHRVLFSHRISDFWLWPYVQYIFICYNSLKPDLNKFEFVSARCLGALSIQDHFKINFWLEVLQIKQKYNLGQRSLRTRLQLQILLREFPCHHHPMPILRQMKTFF